MLEKITHIRRAKILATGLATVAISGPGMYEFTQSTNSSTIEKRADASRCLEELGNAALITERTAPASCQDYVTEIRASQAASDQDSTQPIPASKVEEWAQSTLTRDIADPALAAQTGLGIGTGLWLMGVGIAMASSSTRNGKDRNN